MIPNSRICNLSTRWQNIKLMKFHITRSWITKNLKIISLTKYHTIIRIFYYIAYPHSSLGLMLECYLWLLKSICVMPELIRMRDQWRISIIKCNKRRHQVMQVCKNIVNFVLSRCSNHTICLVNSKECSFFASWKFPEIRVLYCPFF